MVLGMSGRSGEPRRGNPQVKKEKSSSENMSQQQTTQPPQKFKPPSAEQVHIARILEERTPADIDDLVRQVLAVVNRPEEDINIALHDNDYNVEKTIEAMLDSSSSTQEEWTTMATSKKGRKKQQESEEQTSRGKGSSWLRENRGNRSANKSRESFSGNVTTETAETKVNREDQTSRGSKGRPYSSGRGPKRYNNNREGRKDRDFRTDRGPPYGRKKEWNSSNIHTAPASKLSEDNWEVDEEPVHGKSTGWESKLVSTPPVDESCGGDEEWVIVDPPTSSEQGDFPVAFPQGGVSSSSSSPPRDDHTCTTYIEDKRSLNSPSQDNITLKSNKTRRYRSSRIPSQPVEMPRWIDTLTLEFGSLGVDFVGSETTLNTDEPASSPTVLLSNQTFQEIPPSSPQVTQSASPLINTAHYTTSLPEDTAVIAMSTATFSETPPTKLDPPPGLTHPSQHNIVAPATTGLLSGPPEPISMPPQTTNKLEGLLTSGGTGTANLPSVSFPLSLPVTTGPTTHVTTPNFSAAGSTSQAEPLFSTQSTSVTIVTNPIPSSQHVSTSSVVMTATGNNKTGVTHSGKVHSNVHPMAATGMVYPHMLHQFPHYGTAPMMVPTYPYDVETLNRYQGFYSQHQTTQDQTGLSGAGVGGRGDHPTSSYSTDNKYDMTSPVGAANPNNTQQQGGIQNHPFYNPYIYTIGYGPHLGMPGYSAQIGHKHGGGTTYPVGSSYQPTPQGQYGLPYEEEYTKLYAGSAMPKTNSVPSTSAGSEFTGYSKYDTKGGGAYSSYVPTGPPMGGYMMAPHVPPQMGGPIMTTPHDASSRSKHSKTYWNPTHT